MNALQGGVRGDLGKTPEKILGVPAQEATGEDVAKLSESEREEAERERKRVGVGRCELRICLLLVWLE